VRCPQAIRRGFWRGHADRLRRQAQVALRGEVGRQLRDGGAVAGEDLGDRGMGLGRAQRARLDEAQRSDQVGPRRGGEHRGDRAVGVPDEMGTVAE
jgi:hypothetical protein